MWNFFTKKYYLKKTVKVKWLNIAFRNFFWLLLTVVILQRSLVPPASSLERIRVFTRQIEFDYVSWTFNALFLKGKQVALDISLFISEEKQVQLVKDYIQLVKDIQQTEAEIKKIYSDPAILEPELSAKDPLDRLNRLREKDRQLAPVAEAILQLQVSTVLAEQGLTLAGQPIPPVLYHVTPLPMALIVSPRNIIRQDADISLLPDLTLDQITTLEKSVENQQNVSALVVPIGGIGIYPTMVMRTADLPWLVEVISHEWVHNFLTLRPLGIRYGASPELRTMNETTASIGGKEISRAVIARYYPEYLPPPEEEEKAPSSPPAEPKTPPPFDFRKEMHITRVAVDRLLAEGKNETAEQYMELRRRFFWDNGYQIRRLNQAYFAFYGAYADEPGGAAGSDPVGPAVRALREQSPSLAQFLNRISWMTSFEHLKAAIHQ